VNSQPVGTLGLECVIGGQRFALPAESVAQIVEYDVSPLPHGGRWVAGLGLLGTRVLVSVALAAPGGAARGRRSTKGVLLNAPSSPVGWALEVSEVSSFVHVEVDAAGAPPRPGRGSLLPAAGRDVPSWLGRARTSDGRTLAWIDAQEIVRALSVHVDRDSAFTGPSPGAGQPE
jgi:chemotaxis signal transduction protein